MYPLLLVTTGAVVFGALKITTATNSVAVLAIDARVRVGAVVSDVLVQRYSLLFAIGPSAGEAFAFVVIVAAACFPARAVYTPPLVTIFVLLDVGEVSTELFPVPPFATASVPEVMFVAE